MHCESSIVLQRNGVARTRIREIDGRNASPPSARRVDPEVFLQARGDMKVARMALAGRLSRRAGNKTIGVRPLTPRTGAVRQDFRLLLVFLAR